MTNPTEVKSRRAKHKYDVAAKAEQANQVVLGSDYRMNMINALNHFNQIDNDEKKRWALAYFKQHHMPTTHFDKLTDYDFRTVGTLIRIHTAKFQLMEQDVQRINKQHEQLLKLARGLVKDTQKIAPEMSIQQRLKNKAGAITEDIDYYLDQLFSGITQDSFDVKQFIAQHNVNPALAKLVVAYVQPTLDDLMMEDAEEVYAMPKRRLNAIRKNIEGIIEGLTQDAAVKKAIGKVRSPRAKKQKPAAQIVANLKGLQKFDQLVAVPSTGIVGADVVVIYDTSKRKLTMYSSGSVNGLSVKNSTITGFDIDQSFTKTIRNPGIIPDLLKLTKRPLRKAFGDIKAIPTVPSGRVTDKMIVLATHK